MAKDLNNLPRTIGSVHALIQQANIRLKQIPEGDIPSAFRNRVDRMLLDVLELLDAQEMKD